MPLKMDEPETLVEIDRWDGGVGWFAHPEETMQRASHALRVDDEVWLVDPLDVNGVDELVAELGSVAGVVVTLDRHTRDASTLARRHGVSVHLPKQLAGVAREIDAPVELFDGELEDTGYRVLPVLDWPGWREVALYHETDGTLVIGDALGTAPYFCTATERLGVSPALRLFPPRSALGQLTPERVLVGHGSGIMTNATEALDDALRGARRNAPRLYVDALKLFFPI